MTFTARLKKKINIKRVVNAVQKNNLQWKNSKCTATDISKNMCGKKIKVSFPHIKGRRKWRWFKTFTYTSHHSSTVFVWKMIVYVRILKALMQTVNYIISHALIVNSVSILKRLDKMYYHIISHDTGLAVITF